MMRAYNDWIADFCRYDPSRLKGIGMINVDDPDDGARELTRCREIGLHGALVTVAPPPWLPFRDAAYDRLWATAQDLDMPLSMHTATDRADPKVGKDSFRLDVKNVPPSVFINKDMQIRLALADLILSGVFERFPGLRIGTIEHELSWIPFFLDQMDYTYTDRPPRGEWYRFKEQGMLPSDYYRRQVFASFQEDAVGIRVRDVIGLDTMMWGSDYPHTESTFPRSQEIVAEILGDIPPPNVLKIVSTNAANLYQFDVPPKPEVAP
jgi:predicted TIM-barrel fold metal-dependent hydrolase